MEAVITADIVNSTQLSENEEKQLRQSLETIFAGHKMEFYRGDSFQSYQKDAREAYRLALLCRAKAISLSQENQEQNFDIRMSIGIGKHKEPVKQLATAKSEAFIISGRSFDEMNKSTQRLSIQSPNALANAGLAVIADYTDHIFGNLTGRQAGVIFELLKGQTIQAAADTLEKSKSTVHQHATAGRWIEIENNLQHYVNIINLLQ